MAVASAFSPLQANDHAGTLWVVTIVGLVYAFVSGIMRMHIKQKAYGWDDYILALATVRLHPPPPTSQSFNSQGYTEAVFELTIRHLLGTLCRASRAHLRRPERWPWKIQLHHNGGSMASFRKGRHIPYSWLSEAPLLIARAPTDGVLCRGFVHPDFIPGQMLKYRAHHPCPHIRDGPRLENVLLPTACEYLVGNGIHRHLGSWLSV